MGRQLFQDGPYIDPQIVVVGALVATTIEPLWIAATYTPIFANDPKAGKIYCVRAGGILSTSASASTLIITPLWTAVALGPSITQTVPASLANVAWRLEFDLVIRSVLGAGLNSVAVGTGIFVASGLTTVSSQIVLGFGGTIANVDVTINGAIGISKTLSVAGSFTTLYQYMFSRN